MIIFKNYFRIVNQQKLAILMYSVLFVIIAFMFSSTGQGNVTEYSSEKVDIYVENLSHSKFAEGLEDYLKANTRVVDIDPELVEDELFYGVVQAVVRIPENFESAHQVEFKSAPKSMYGMLITQKVNEFINKVVAYETSGYSINESIDFANADFSNQSTMELVSGSTSEEGLGAHNYFNFMNYVLMSQIILIITSVMLVYNREIMVKRNEVSPVSRTSQNLQLTLGHIIIGILVWLVYVGVFFMTRPETFGSIAVNLLILNSFVFMISVVTFAVLLSRLISNEGALMGILNVFSLGSSFLAGAFVPQEMLSDFTLNLAKVLPSYYYITNNNRIANNPAFATMAPYLLVMLAFSLIFVIISMIAKPKYRL